MKAPYFPVGTEEWMANITYIDPKKRKIKHGPMEITYYSAHHPGITYGYNIKIKNKTIIAGNAKISEKMIELLK